MVFGAFASGPTGPRPRRSAPDQQRPPAAEQTGAPSVASYSAAPGFFTFAVIACSPMLPAQPTAPTARTRGQIPKRSVCQATSYPSAPSAAAPRYAPCTNAATCDTPEASVAVAVTATVPAASASAAGNPIATTGAVVSAKVGSMKPT